MNNWFTVKVKYTKQLENGTFKRVSEPYMLAAMTFTDAEARIYEELGALIRGEFTVVGIARTDVHDIFAYDDSETWYKCKVTYDKVDDEGEGDKKKTISQNYLVTAPNVKDAYIRVQESLSTLMIDFKITIVATSPIVEIFPYHEDDVATISKVITEIVDEISSENTVLDAENLIQSKGAIFSASGSDEEESESNLVDELDDENE